MRFLIQPALDRGKLYAFPVAWVAVLLTGVGFNEPLAAIDPASFLNLKVAEQPALPLPEFTSPTNPDTSALIFVRQDLAAHQDVAAEDTNAFNVRDIAGGHGRFAAPGNAVRRQVQSRFINPRTAEELAGFFREQAYTLDSVRVGVGVPAIKVERVPDLSNKDGIERKMLFITALLPVIDRLRILRLVENLTLGTAAVGYRTESMHGAGSPQAQRIMIARQSNINHKKELAKALAGVGKPWKNEARVPTAVQAD